jgi:hypothetical protein
LEALAYTLVKCGDYSAALDALSELSQSLENETTPWIVAQRNRALLIEEKLLPKPETALDQLESWKAESVRNLKLEKILSRK